MGQNNWNLAAVNILWGLQPITKYYKKDWGTWMLQSFELGFMRGYVLCLTDLKNVPWYILQRFQQHLERPH